MDDVSDFFKSGFLSLHKNTIGKSYQQKTLKDRMHNFNTIRRQTRNTLIFQKRQIDENMTPINTPEPTKIVKKIIDKKEAKKPNKRLEMLNKWKADKEKRKQEEQKKAKPLFKVYHVPVEVGLPNLENVNKEIKGKPIKANPTPIKSQFAPPNHKFRAPKNVKPINLSIRTNNTSFLNKSKVESQKTIKVNSRQNSIISQRTTRSAASKKELTNGINEKQTKVEIKKANSGHTRGQNNFIAQKTAPVNPKTEIKSTLRSKITEPIQRYTPNKNNRKKPQFKNSSVVDINTSVDVKCSSPKRNRRDDKTAKGKAILGEAASVLGRRNSPFKHTNQDRKKLETESYVETDSKIKKTPKKSIIMRDEVSNSNEVVIVNEKKKSVRMMKTPKLENKSVNTLNKPKKSAGVTPKKVVGWNVVEIIESDDEVFSEEIDTKTPKRVARKYKKTPRKGQKMEAEEEPLTIEVNDEINSPSTPKNSRNKTPIKNISVGSDEEEDDKTLTNVTSKSRNSTVGSATGSTSPDYPIECVNLTEKSFNTAYTPVKRISREASPVYISPFVTISRGKNSARKEYQVRQSTGGSLNDTLELEKDISNNVSPKAGADYFTKKLNNEIAKIDVMCDNWGKYKTDNDLPEEATDMIDVAIGQSKLLISKKFQQFRCLIDQCKNSDYEDKPVTCKDLHGFWDMIYMQVEDLNKRFANLDILKANNWQEVVPEKKPVVKRGRGRPKKAAASSKLKNLIKAARNKAKSNDDGENLMVLQSNETMFSSGDSSIKSSFKESRTPTPRSSSARKSLRVSLLASQAKSRISSSPGLTMMKISQAIKSGDGLTPSKSILKTDLTKSANRIMKSVLFKDDLEDNIGEHFKSSKTVLFRKVDDSVNKENDPNDLNLISFSPVTSTRRSRRLSKVNL